MGNLCNYVILFFEISLTQTYNYHVNINLRYEYKIVYTFYTIK